MIFAICTCTYLFIKKNLIRKTYCHANFFCYDNVSNVLDQAFLGGGGRGKWLQRGWRPAAPLFCTRMPENSSNISLSYGTGILSFGDDLMSCFCSFFMKQSLALVVVVRLLKNCQKMVQDAVELPPFLFWTNL